MFKQIAFIVFVISCQTLASQHKANMNGLFQFVYGFAKSMKAFESVAHAGICKDAIKANYNETIALVEQLQHIKNLADLIEVFEKVKDLIPKLEQGCGQALSELKSYSYEIATLLTNATNLEEGIKRLERHPIELTEDIYGGIKDLKEQQYESAGEKFGDIGKVFLFPEAVFGPLTTFAQLQEFDLNELNLVEFDIQKLKDFVIGVFIQLNATGQIPHAFPCVSEVDVAVQVSKEIEDLIKQKNIEAFKKAFELLMSEFKNLSSVCAPAVAEGKQFIQPYVEFFSDKVKIAEGIARLTAHMITVTEDISSMIEDIKQNNFTKAGMDFGKLIDLFVNGKVDANIQSKTVKKLFLKK